MPTIQRDFSPAPALDTTLQLHGASTKPVPSSNDEESLSVQPSTAHGRNPFITKTKHLPLSLVDFTSNISLLEASLLCSFGLPFCRRFIFSAEQTIASGENDLGLNTYITIIIRITGRENCRRRRLLRQS